MSRKHQIASSGFSSPKLVLLCALAVTLRMVPARAQDIKYSPDPNAAKNMTLLLKDFDPRPMLHVPTHEVPRAKFPVIDVHNHVNDPGGVHGEEISPAEVIRRMDQANVEKIVILTGQWGAKLQGVIDKMVKPYPDRFMVFTQIDYSKIDDPRNRSNSCGIPCAGERAD